MIVQMSELDPGLTLMDSAQAFHWTRCADGFAAIVNGGATSVARTETGWQIESEAGDEEARAYFALDGFGSLIEGQCISEIPGDGDIVTRAIRALPGLRVLRQSPWDALLAFLCSANNNTARIRTLCLCLCDYGETRVFNGMPARGYPSPEALANVSAQELRDRKFGYRADYIAKTAKMVADGFPLEKAKTLPYVEARELLMRLPGVGGKVADCVLLFGCGHEEAFPVDVWVERLLREWFGLTATNRDKLSAIARERFGPRAGVLQQYLFHCARTGALPLTETRKEEKLC